MPFDWDGSGIHRVYDAAREMRDETRRVWVEDLRARFAGREPRRILDVGCGTGRHTRLAREAFPEAVRVLGVDPSHGMLAAARSRDPSGCFGFLRARVEALPFASASFDAVLLAMVLHHVPAPETAFREMGRLLAPGGLVYLRTPTRECVDPTSWQACFPGARRIAERVLPRRERVRSCAAAAGLRLREEASVCGVFARGVEEYLGKIGARAISSLRQIPDAEFEAGLRALTRRCRELPETHVFEERIDVFVFAPPTA